MKRSPKRPDRAESFARGVLERARTLGARQAEVYLETSRLSAVRVRDGELEDLTQATGKGLGLRVFAAGGLGFSYTSEFDAAGVDAFVSRAIALAKLSAKDSKNELPKPHPGAPPSKV